MRNKLSQSVEMGRVVQGQFASKPGSGPQGAFMIRHQHKKTGKLLKVMASDGRDWPDSIGEDVAAWEHVSVSTQTRCPTWEEMTFIRHCFWKPDELVVEYHMPVEEHINLHPYTLHLWRPVAFQMPVPPKACV